jgi:hypothetical protein
MTVKELILITIVLPFFITACTDKYSEQDKIQAINNVDTPFGAYKNFKTSQNDDVHCPGTKCLGPQRRCR